MGLRITAASPDDRAGPAGGGWHRARLPLLTRRRLQVALGILWLLDGGLQFQPFMFSRGFLMQVIEPAAAGQPRIVAVSILGAAHLMSRHLALYNSGAATIQILIGVGLLFPRTVKPALLASFGWALGVCAFGERFGLLLTGQASLLTGAPGAVLLYVLAGLLIWPADRPTHGCVASQGLLNDLGGRLMWANLWLGFAVLSVLPANITSSGVSGAFQAGGSIALGPLAHLDAALGRMSAGHGTPITILLAVLEAGIGVGIMHDRWRNTAAVLGIAFVLALWVTTEGLGGLITGQATDPNSGSLLVLLSAALYVPAAIRSRQATKQKGVTRSRLPRWRSSASSGIGCIDESRHHGAPRRSHQRIGPCPRSLGERNSDAKKTLPGHAGGPVSRDSTRLLWACSRGTSDR